MHADTLTHIIYPTSTAFTYTIYTLKHAGIHTEVLKDLMDKMSECEGKHMVLTFDEMKIKDLVYNKHTGQIIGYVNLGNTEQQLLLLEKGDKGTSSHVATHILQFMV